MGYIGSHNFFVNILNGGRTFFPRYNGISMMATDEWSEPDAIFPSDAWFLGCGSWYKEKGCYFHSQFPELIQQMRLHINALEMLTIRVATNVWGRHWKGKRIIVNCDNEASVTVINTGRSKDLFLQACLTLTGLEGHLCPSLVKGLEGHICPTIVTSW